MERNGNVIAPDISPLIVFVSVGYFVAMFWLLLPVYVLSGGSLDGSYSTNNPVLSDTVGLQCDGNHLLPKSNDLSQK